MNFFGHAVVATFRSDAAEFVLGAMLPDFANMLGTRPPGVAHAGLAAGVAFHHDTDRIFHDAPTFKSLQAEARKTLREMGLPRPSALAVGHIGVEILLDGALAADARGVRGYLGALAVARDATLVRHLAWNDDALRARFDALAAALADRGVTPSSQSAAAAAFRVTRALAPRPRLALTEEGAGIVLAWAEASAGIVAAAATGLVEEVRAGLGLAASDPA